MKYIPSFLKTEKFDKFFEDLMCVNIGLYIVTSVFQQSVVASPFSSLNHKLMWVTFFIPMLKIAYDFLRGKYYIIESIIYFFLVLFGYYIRLKSGSGGPLVLFLYIASCRNIDPKKFLKVAFWSLTISLAIAVLSAILLNEHSKDVLQTRYGVSRIRHAFGFVWVTISANIYLAIVTLSIFVIKKWKIYHYIIFLLINIFFFVANDTKNAFALSVLTLLLILINNCKGTIITSIISKLNIILYILGAGFIFIASMLYIEDNAILFFLNNLTSGRLYLTQKGLATFPITLFGGRVSYGGIWIDSSYADILFHNGIIFLALVIIILTIYSYLAYKRKDNILVIFLFITALHSIFDTQLIMLMYNPVFALFAHYLFKNARLIEE